MFFLSIINKLLFFLSKQLPPEFLSSSEYLLLRFRSDDSVHGKGFSVAYQALDANEDGQIIDKP